MCFQPRVAGSCSDLDVLNILDFVFLVEQNKESDDDDVTLFSDVSKIKQEWRE